MKKATTKTLAVLALIAGLVIGAVGNGLLAYIGGVMLATIGLLTLLGKEEVLYY